jgi:hypothetical protein
MRRFSACLLLPAVFATPALAEPLKFKPLIDTRLRYEHVEQAGPITITDDAEAVTIRARAGFELSNKVWSFLAEAEGTLAINEDYNSGLNGKANFPVVADPENIELNRIQLQFKGLPKTVITGGRQRINLDDQRFVGSVGWRDNEQTFDAARVEWTGIKGLKVDLTYAWSNRTIWGIDGTPLTTPPRPQAIEGDNVFANVAYTTKFGTLTGFAYLVDQDELPAAILRNSSQTYGARFAGGYALSKAVKLTYTASYARQSDYHNNPLNYSADYYLGELGIEAKGWKLLGGYEVLGGDSTVTNLGAPFAGGFAFMTPYATLHKFQGWADKFLVTPANGALGIGIRDAYGSIGYTKPKVGPFASIGATLVYHDYRSDEGSRHYGNEWNAQIVAKLKKYTFTLKYADYDAGSVSNFGGGNGDFDTKKFWASVEWAF